MHGATLPAGLLESSQLPEPVFTPSTKAEVGDHDENISLRARRSSSSAPSWPSGPATCRSSSTAAAPAWAAERGIIIADTKFELGLVDGELVAVRRGADAGLVAVLAGRRVGAGHARRRRSTSSRCATTSTALDWDKTAAAPAAARRGRRRPPAPATSRPTSASPADRSPTGPGVALT